MSIEVEATRVFYRNAESEAPIIFNRGGARSTKSYSVSQLLSSRLLQARKRKILILRKTLPSLKLSTHKVFKEIWGNWGATHHLKEEKMTLDYYYKDNWMHFGSLDDPEKIKCYHPNTEVMTDKGFLSITELKKGMRVASINPDTLKVEYKEVSEMHEYDYDGDLISPASETGDGKSYAGFAVTPEHHMLISTKRKKNYRFVKAENLPSFFYVPQKGNWDTGKIINNFEIPRIPWDKKKNNNWGKKPVKFPIIPWLRFLGWYLTEGSCELSNNTVILSQHNEKGREKIKRDLKDFPIKLVDGEKFKRFSFYSKDLANYVKQFGLSYEKYIPRDILDLHPSLLRHLFEALVDGDGYRHVSGRICYSTASPQLRDDVCEVAIKLGLVPTIYTLPKSKQFEKAKQAWNISITTREKISVSKIKRWSYSGKVYCPTVPPYHTIMTRYDGRVMWCGQSTDWNDIMLEEATEFTYEDFQQLRLRMSSKVAKGDPINQLFACFNPTDEFHWLKEKVLDVMDGVDDIHSTYKDNPYLDPAYIDLLESLKEIDPNKWKIYGLGRWGKLDNIIYSNWELVDKVPDNVDEVIYGLDFGFNNPSALVKISICDKVPYEEELFYEAEHTTKDLIGKLEGLIEDKNDSIYADAAEPDRIEEIRRAGFNIIPADKSVNDGIDFVKTLPCKILKGSFNLIKEVRGYSWKEDKNGRVLDTPVKFNDHLMDGRRYAYYTHIGKRADFRIRWL